MPAASLSPIEIIIADDHPLFLSSLKRMVNDVLGFKLVGEAKDGHELIEQCKTLMPDIVITDIKMPRMDGIEAAKQLTRELPNIGIIALSILDEENVIVDMLEAGAKGYLLKSAPVDVVIKAVQMV